METREVGKTGVTLSRLGLGTVPLVGMGVKAVDYDGFEAVVLAALKAGVSYIDTAPMYGMGRAEHFLGHALRTNDLVGEVTLSTKVGRLLKPASSVKAAEGLFGITWDGALPFVEQYDYTYDGIMRSFEDSQQRFGIERFDILHVHDIGELTHGDQSEHYWRQLGEGGYRALDELRAGGGARAISIGVNETAAVERMASEFEIDSCLLAGRYTLLNHGPLDGFFPAMQKRGVAVIAAGVFNSGILGGGSKGETRIFDYMAAPPEIIARVEKLEAVCARHDVALPDAALQFVSAHPSVTCILQGCKNVAEITQNTTALSRPIPAALWRDMREEGLLPAKAPTPEGA